jgi:hypothetical protein
MNLKELRDFVCESERGQIFDSLICVELGLEEYEAFWIAHQDMNQGMSFEDSVVKFLMDLHDYIGFSSEDIEKVLVTADE